MSGLTYKQVVGLGMLVGANIGVWFLHHGEHALMALCVAVSLIGVLLLRKGGKP